MAREESDREDLLREATALVERIELSPLPSDAHSRGNAPLPVPVRDRERASVSASSASKAETIVVGFRAGGAASIFFGSDPVYQFNAAGELRRAYCDGLLFKAVRRRLVSLERVRKQGEVQLLRHDLSDAEQDVFIARMQERLSALTNVLAHHHYMIVGQVPADTDVLGRVRKWLAACGTPSISNSSHVGSRALL
jgi:hypothetical protein